jgi:ribonuclease HI
VLVRAAPYVRRVNASAHPDLTCYRRRRWTAYFDGTYDPQRNLMGLAAVVVNPDGKVVLRRLARMDGGDNNEAEARAALMAIVALRELNNGRPPKGSFLVGDNEPICLLVASRARTTRQPLREVISEARRLLGSCKVRWVPRQRNRAADHVAARAVMLKDGQITDTLPPWEHERPRRRKPRKACRRRNRRRAHARRQPVG